MDRIEVEDGHASRPVTEMDADGQRRAARETELIAEADADVAAGRLVESTKVKAWIDSIGTDHELAVPYFSR